MPTSRQPSKLQYDVESGPEHIRNHPEFYGASTSRYIHTEPMLNPDGTMLYTKTDTPECITRMFMEPLNNAYDRCKQLWTQGVRVQPIEVDIDSQSVSITNYGTCMPVETNEKGDYIPQVMMSKPKSSSNYRTKTSGSIGMFGMGIKVTNCNSTWLRLENADAERGLLYVQEWYDRMTQMSEPSITDYTGNTSYVNITYQPDFQLMGYTQFTDDHIMIMSKYVLDVAYTSGLAIDLNTPFMSQQFTNVTDEQYATTCFGELANIGTLTNQDQTLKLVLADPSNPPDRGNTIMSFVNTMCTPSGGTHVDATVNVVTTAIRDAFNSKLPDDAKKISIKPIKSALCAIVVAYADEPKLQGAHKGKLIEPKYTFTVTDKNIAPLLKWKFMGTLNDYYTTQRKKVLKATDGKKIKHIPAEYEGKYRDANWAGGPDSHRAELIIVEGDSASGYPNVYISLDPDGSWKYGIVCTGGKPPNVSSGRFGPEELAKNKFILILKLLLGLKEGLDYTDPKAYKSLRYGKVKIFVDADPDGSHIKGLVYNYFREYFPSLLVIGFIENYNTPIIRAYKGKQVVNLYTKRQAEEWVAKNGKSWSLVYSKGLGTASKKDVINDAKNPRITTYTFDGDDIEAMDMMFSPKRADERKEVILASIGDPLDELEYDSEPMLNFLAREFMEFMILTIDRHIPDILCGLKDVQRKVVWCCYAIMGKKRGESKQVKMTTLVGDVIARTAYAHGNKSVADAATVLGRTFAGSNNINLLAPDGQYGTRSNRGHDAASERYLNCSKGPLFHYVLRDEDYPILELKEGEGGKLNEPKFFLPIVPLHVVNGSDGIACGWQSKLPCHSPLDVIDWLVDKLEDRVPLTPRPWSRCCTANGYYTPKENSPYYEYNSEGRFYYDYNTSTLVITELPDTMSPAKLVAKLDYWTNPPKPDPNDKTALKEPVIKDYVQDNCDDNIWYVIEGISDELLEFIGLVKKRVMSSIVIQDTNNRPMRYNTVDALMEEFYRQRSKYYDTRKTHKLKVLKAKRDELSLKLKFMELYHAGEIVIYRTPTSKIKSQLAQHDIPYSIYSSLKLHSLDLENIGKLEAKIAKVVSDIDYLESTPSRDIWKSELLELREKYLDQLVQETVEFCESRIRRLEWYRNKHAHQPFVLKCIDSEVELMREYVEEASVM